MNQSHFEILQSSIDRFNRWRQDNPDITPDLRGVDLAGANLSRANLSRANLSRANLSRANLTGTNLAWADLTEANLTGANLTGANLTATFHQVPGWDFSFVKGLIGGTLFSVILWGIIILIIFDCV